MGIENRLWKLLEALRTGMDVEGYCKEWWQLTNADWLRNIDVRVDAHRVRKYSATN